MNFMQFVDARSIKAGVRTASVLAKKYTPELLTGVSIVAGVTATVVAVRQTPKAMRLIEERKQELGVSKMTPMMKVEAGWKPYLPVLALSALSVGCSIASNRVSFKRLSALTASLALSDKAYTTLAESVKSTLPDKQQLEVKKEVAKRNVGRGPLSDEDVALTPFGTTLFYEPKCGRYFRTNVNKIKDAEVRVNNILRRTTEFGIGRNDEHAAGQCSLSELYLALGLDMPELGDECGWRLKNLRDNSYLHITWEPVMYDEDEAALHLIYSIEPEFGFDK